jgi:hypothetical protein
MSYKQKKKKTLKWSLFFMQFQIVAFVLEAFFAEMELESSEKCTEQDKVGSCSELFITMEN